VLTGLSRSAILGTSEREALVPWML
jgi:hypothetical protein